MPWVRKHLRAIVLITTAIAGLPFLPEWVKTLVSVGSQILSSGDLAQ